LTILKVDPYISQNGKIYASIAKILFNHIDGQPGILL